jgi:hypothetical protein
MSRNIALDILKLSMTFMVVGIHTGFLGDFTLLGQFITSEGIFRIAVPVFLLINGYYFYSVVTERTQTKWFKRVLVLYAFWMCFYIYFWFPLNGFSIIEAAKLIGTVIIGYHHLWYISGMLGAALILLLLRDAKTILIVSSIVILFIIGVFIQYIGTYHLYPNSLFDTFSNFTWSHRNFLFISYPFFALGYLIKKHSLCLRISFTSVILLSTMGTVLLIGESFVNYYQTGRDGGIDNYFSLLLACPAIFILFMKMNITGSSKNISLFASAIYFIHPFIFSVFRTFTSYEQTLITFAVILTSSFVSIYIIKLNNKFKWIL